MKHLMNSNNLTYKRLIENFSTNPRNVQTHPINRSAPKWFYVQAVNNELHISNARMEHPSVSITTTRKLISSKFDPMYELHKEREKGRSVARLAQNITQNASYWFGVLYAFEHEK